MAVQSLYWLCSCSYFAFILPYLQQHGFTNAQCGLAVTLQFASCLILQPLFGYITDTFFSCRRFFMAITLLSIPVAFLLPAVIDNVPLALAAIFLFSCFFSSNESIISVWLLLLRDERPYINFEITRGTASIAFAVFALFFGFVVQRFGMKMMFVVYGVLAVCLVLACTAIPDAPCQNTRTSLQANGAPLTTAEVARNLFTNKPYLLFLLGALCFQISLRATKVFLPNYVALVGGKEQELGFIYFISAMIEMPALYLVGRINRRFRVEYSYLLAIVGLGGSLFFLKTLSSMGGLAAAMLFSGVGFIAMMGTTIEFIKGVTPRQYTSSALSIGMALTNALGAILGSFFGGVMIDFSGLGAMTGLCILFYVLAILFFLPLLRSALKHTPSPLQQ